MEGQAAPIPKDPKKGPVPLQNYYQVQVELHKLNILKAFRKVKVEK